MIKVIAINDLHIPYQNKRACYNVGRFMEDYKPDKLVICGDFVDFYKLSRFDKDPERFENIQDELDEAEKYLEIYKNLVPEIHFIQGNHEQRLKKYLWKNPELHGLKVLRLPELLGLNKLGIEYHDHEYIFNDFVFTHGSVLSTWSGGTARKEHQKHGCSGISGHSHRGGVHYLKNYQGDTGWFENFCLCDLNPEYVEGIPNWMNGFSVIVFDDDRFHCTQVPIVDNAFIFGEKLYK